MRLMQAQGRAIPPDMIDVARVVAETDKSWTPDGPVWERMRKREMDIARRGAATRGAPPIPEDMSYQVLARVLENPRLCEEALKMMAQAGMIEMGNSPFAASGIEVNYAKAKQTSEEIAEAKKAVAELTEILERVQKEPLILHTVDRITKDGKHTFVRKGDIEMRIETCPDLARGDEVLLHPKSLQIVERMGRPPLEASPFAPDKIPDVKWDDIGGLEDAKADLIEAIEMPHKYRELFAFYNKKQIKGILLSGPPGCGKTMLGKAAAKALADCYGKEGALTGFLYVKGPEILNQYVGQTEQTIRDMFFHAQRHKEEHGYPAIIFLDEADAILAARGTRNVGIGNTIVPQFLTEMDGLEDSSAIVIIATNRPDVLDPAIVRDGRIDRKVAVTRPTIESAIDILKLNLSNVPIHEGFDKETLASSIATIIYDDNCRIPSGQVLREIVNGAMLANTVNIAVSSAIKRDTDKKKPTGLHFDDAVAAIERIRLQSDNLQHDL